MRQYTPGKKCRRCNFRTKCHLSSVDCNAMNKKCFSCKKPDHFPQSMNCKKTRQAKFKVKLKSLILSGCMRLREFLKTKRLKLKYHLLSEAQEKERWQESKSKQKITPKLLKITTKLLKLINNRIRFLENVENESLQPDELVKTKLTFSPLRIRGGGTDIPIRIPAFKSSFPAVDAVAYMFRSLQEDWSHFQSHPLCSHSAKTESGFPCFFCYIRNLSIRTCKPKQTRMVM